MKTRLFSLFCLCAAAFVAPYPSFSADGPGYSGLIPGDVPAEKGQNTPKLETEEVPSQAFHLPKTTAEKALNTMLALDKEAGGILLMPAGDSPPKNGVMPPFLFTPKFLGETMEKGKKLRGSTDGDDQYYAFLGAFLTCGKPQDSGDSGWIFHTMKENRDNAAIMPVPRERVERGKPVKGPIYRMVKDGGNWKLDDIICRN